MIPLSVDIFTAIVNETLLDPVLTDRSKPNPIATWHAESLRATVPQSPSHIALKRETYDQLL